MRRSMPKTTYLIELHVDEEWFKAIDRFTADVHDGEVCEWVRVDAETTIDETDCDNCGDYPKEDQKEYCKACLEEFEGTE